jgi:hypothetical protein
MPGPSSNMEDIIYVTTRRLRMKSLIFLEKKLVVYKPIYIWKVPMNFLKGLVIYI